MKDVDSEQLDVVVYYHVGVNTEMDDTQRQ